MLALLQIDNYALIEQAEIEFAPGFNVLTGETGSGKSIIVDALGLLLGERAEAGAVRTGAAAATVTGSFTSPFPTPAEANAWCLAHGLSELGAQILLRREVTAAGRSRAFVDGQLTTLALMRELASGVGEIHSQHESLVSFTPAAQLRLLDRFASAERELEATAAAHAAWSGLNARQRDAAARERLRLQQTDLWRFQAGEIDALRPLPGEDAALESERRALAHAEKIAAAAQAAYAALYDAPEAASAQLKTALRHVGEWHRFDDGVAPLLPRLEALRAETTDIAEHIRALAERVEASPARLAHIEDRLAALDRLRRKYGPTLADVLRHRAELDSQLEQASLDAASQTDAEARLEAAAAEYRRCATALARKRRAAAPRLAKELEAEVADLAMTLRFQTEFDDETNPDAVPAGERWTASGWDRIRFLASTNPGEPPLPVAEIASGGELSRLLLALHLAAPGRQADENAARRELRTLVLDEVDAGIGGRAADAVGRKLQQLGRHYQVLCVTHLAQIATFANHHLQVEKIDAAGRTLTRVRALDLAGRVAEVARMLAGNQLNPTSLRHARELLAAHAASA